MSMHKGSTKSKIWFRVISIFMVTCIVGGVGYLIADFLLSNNQQSEVVAPIKPQNGIPIEIGIVSKTINVTGKLLPAQQESISVEKNTAIDNVYYSVGSRIEKGHKVIDITTNDIKSDVININNLQFLNLTDNISTSNTIQQNSSVKKSVSLIAHINGRVEEVNVKSKQVATDLIKPAMLIIDDSSYTLQTNINETDIVSVSIGQVANIRLKAFPGMTFTGKVKQIDASGIVGVSGETFYGVQIVLDEVNSNFKIGMTGEADLFIANIENTLRLPLNYVVLTGNGKGEVNILDETGVLVTKEIFVGTVGNDFVEITGGLIEGQKVFIIKDERIHERKMQSK